MQEDNNNSPVKNAEEYLSNEQEEEIDIPNRNPTTEAIFNKYKSTLCHIKQQEEDYTFRIKNLDTGEQLQIDNETQEQLISSKLSEGRIDINTSTLAFWKEFWTNVYKNNQKLKQYCENGFYDQAKSIIQNGEKGYPVQIDWKGLDEWTPLHYACYEGHDDLVELLCKNNANINALTKFGRNGLHIATLRGHYGVVQILISNKIQINAYDSDGNTALHFAAQNNHQDIIMILIQNGCKLKRNGEGLTPIDVCHHQYLKQIFNQYGFKENQNYEQNISLKKKNPNKVLREFIGSDGLTHRDFIYYKKIGRGAFGQVYLAQKKEDDSGNLYAIKVLPKSKLGANNLKRYAITERNVLSSLNHPFMVKLHYAFQSQSKLFLVMEYYPGGDLGKQISQKKNFSEEQARRYVCQIILALEALHRNMIVFRDLKPDNIVLDEQGHCRLTDFGLSKEGIYDNKTQSFCGSIAYFAPEILSKQGHSRTVDWYLVGVLLYELIVGSPPYYDLQKEILFENIQKGPLKIPNSMSLEAQDLIKKLLSRDPKKRLGAIKDSQQIKQHAFFKGVDWQKVLNRQIKMPPVQISEIDIQQTISPFFEETQIMALMLKDGLLSKTNSDFQHQIFVKYFHNNHYYWVNILVTLWSTLKQLHRMRDGPTIIPNQKRYCPERLCFIHFVSFIKGT